MVTADKIVYCNVPILSCFFFFRMFDKNWWFGWFGLLGWFGWFGWLPGAFGARSLAKLAAARWDGHVIVYGQWLADRAPSAQDRWLSSRQHGGTAAF